MKLTPSLRSIAGAVGLAAGALLAAAVGSRAEPAAEGKPAPEKRFSAEEVAFYEKQVRPILKASCLRCHGEEKVRGGLRLTSRESVLKGGDLGPAVSLEK